MTAFCPIRKTGLGKLEGNLYKSPRIEEEIPKARGKTRQEVSLDSQLSLSSLNNPSHFPIASPSASFAADASFR